MLLLFAVAAVSSAPVNSATTSPVVKQATATVRILSGVQLKLDAPTNDGAPPARDSKIMVDGSQQAARLIEFE